MIRSLTIGLPIFQRSTSELREELTALRETAASLASKMRLSMRTTRLSLPPPLVHDSEQPGALLSIVKSAEELANAAGARWYCLPIDLFEPRGLKSRLEEAQRLVLRDTKLFMNLIVADQTRISMDGARAASEFILSLARRSVTGIDNFRVGVSAACPAGAPFFPFSRHDGDTTTFSLAMETTAAALDVAERARAEHWSLTQFQDELVAVLRLAISQVDEFGQALSAATGIRYRGLDASFAPFPDGKTSVARLVQLLGPTPVGAHGSLFATSVLTDALKKAGNDSSAALTGFNGVMYSVMEDEDLATANNLRSISLAHLTSLATLCGCGIDMVPVPSSMYTEDVTGLILDIAALAVRLSKPLGVRILPIPHKAVNEFSQMNLDFLCDSRVMDPGVSGTREFLSTPVWSYSNDRKKGPSDD